MFLGRYYHTLEAHGRVSLPKKFRLTTQNWTVTRGLDGGLFVFTSEAFTNQVMSWAHRSFTRKNHRDLVRLFTNTAEDVTTDANGRIQLSEYLVTLAGLTKDIVIVGSSEYLEIWDRDKYHTYLSLLEPQAEALAEELESSKAL